jgi:hypothetical protein
MLLLKSFITCQLRPWPVVFYKNILCKGGDGRERFLQADGRRLRGSLARLRGCQQRTAHTRVKQTANRFIVLDVNRGNFVQLLCILVIFFASMTHHTLMTALYFRLGHEH